MLTREEYEERKRGFEIFNRWERENLPPALGSEASVAVAGALWELLSEEVRTADPDPEKLGVRAFHAKLALLDRRR